MNTDSPPDNYTENLASLTPQEIETLKKSGNTNYASVLIASVVLVLFGAIAFIASGHWIFIAFFGLIDVAMLIWMGLKSRRLNKDLQEGKKKIISGFIEKKDYYAPNSGSTSYYFIVGGKKFSVGYTDYDDFKTGAKIAIHIAPDSDTVLLVESLDRREKDVFKNSDEAHPASHPKAKYSEKFIPLTSEEVQTIKTKRTKTLLGMCVFFVFWYSVLYFIIGRTPDMGFKIFGLIFAVFPFIIVGILLWNAHRDIKFGQKKIITGRIDDKKSHTTSSGTGKNRSTTTYNYFIMSGQEISVSSVHYDNFQTGDIIEMEMLPKSGDVLKVTELYSNTERGESEKKPVFASDREAKKALLNGGHIYDSAPLSMEEEQLLKRLRNKRIFWTLFFGAILGFIAFITLILVFLFVIYPAVKQFNLPRVVNIGIYWSIIAAVVGSFLLVLFKRISPFQRDISGGRKNIIKTVIGDKQRSNVKMLNKNWKVTSSRGDFHYVVIDGIYWEVTPEQFDSIHGGEVVKLHVAPHSGTFLKVDGV